MQVFEIVRDYIDSRGIKRTAVAKSAKIPETTFSAMMNGRRKMYAEDLRNICIALNVSADQFINCAH